MHKNHFNHLNSYLFSSFIAFFLYFFSLPTQLQAQIRDDSTRNIYSTKTTKYFLEEDVYNNKSEKRFLDTSLVDYHKFDVVRQKNFLLQDLGHNLGTATKNVFFLASTRIGTWFGADVYAPYIISDQQMRYFDTRSPYTNLTFVQGGKGQQILNLEFSRNINKRFNFGFLYRRINTSRQYASLGNRDLNAILEQYNAAFHLNYKSKNEKYKILAHYAHFNAQMKELGGAFVPPNKTSDDIYTYSEERSQLLKDPKSVQFQNKLRIYQEYKIDNLLKIFLTNEYFRQRDGYIDRNLAENRNFYGIVPARFKADTTNDDYKFRVFTNQIGIKGRKKNTNYVAYFKRRDYNMGKTDYDSVYRAQFAGKNENYVGGQLNFNVLDSVAFSAEGEYLIGKDYMLKAEISSKFLKTAFFGVTAKSISFSPTIMQQEYVSNTFNWKNNFKNTQINELSGYISYKNKKQTIHIQPFGKYQLINNYIYFERGSRAVVSPTQTAGDIQVAQIGLFAQYKHKKFVFEQTAYYTRNLGASNVLRQPEFMLNASAFLEGNLYKKILFCRIGLDFHYQWEYLADGYMPALKTFYIQNDVVVRPYPLVDFFASTRLQRVRVFFRLNNLLQGVLPAPINGYNTTPYYAGFQRTLSFGFTWLFFD